MNDVEREEVMPGVWRVIAEMGARPYRITANAYLVLGQGESAIVDTAWWNDLTPEHLDVLVGMADAAGSPVRSVFVTHAHRDHSGFVDYLVEQDPTLKVYVHSSEQPTVAAMRNFQGLPNRDAVIEWYRSFGFPTDRAAMIVDTKLPDHPFGIDNVHWVVDEEIIDVGGRSLRILGTPGHTPGHMAIFEEASGILFGGDALLPKGSGNPHVTVRPYTSPDPLSDYVNGLQAVRELNLHVCLPGHGPVVDQPYQLIDAALGYVEQKMAPLQGLFTVEEMTAYDVAAHIPWRGGRKRFSDLVNDEWFLAFGDTLARVRRAVTLGWAREARNGEGVAVFRADGGGAL